MASNPAPFSRPLLLADRPVSGRSEGSGGPRIRRYRIARLELNERRGTTTYEHLKRTYD